MSRRLASIGMAAIAVFVSHASLGQSAADQRFTTLADRKKGIRNDEISTLVRGVVEETAPAGAAATKP